MQHVGARVKQQETAHRRWRLAEAKLDNLPGEVTAGFTDRRRGVPEGAERQTLVEGRPDDEPPRPMSGLDQPVAAQLLQRAADGGAGHGIPGAEFGLGFHAAGGAEFAQGDPFTDCLLYTSICV